MGKAKSNQTKGKILIVEDDRFLHELSKKKFLNEGFRVVSAFDGDEAKEKLMGDTPDVVVLDILLPKTDGMEVLQFIRKQESTKNVPVIIVSNYSDRERIQKGMELGATDYLIKAHFSPDDIVKKVKALIENI